MSEKINIFFNCNSISPLIQNLIINSGFSSFQSLIKFGEKDIEEIERLVRNGKLHVNNLKNASEFSFRPWQRQKFLQLCADLKVFFI